jgi:hypothetical protein
LERFKIPELFIRLVISGVADAHSRVRTFGGLTDRFLLKSSVRQGDPLSPIIYALITDVMHESLKNNPLFPKTTGQGGYTFTSPITGGKQGERVYSAPVKVRISSAGYADDAALVATNPERLGEMHAYMLEFYGAHCFEFAFNVQKTKLMCSDPKKAPPLYLVDGSQCVKPLPAGTNIRYLGLGINLKLNWTKTHTSMERSVLALAERIRRHRMDVPMATLAVKQVLLPRLRLGLLFAAVPDSKLRRWDGILRGAVYKGADMRTIAGLATDTL